jgi:uncharacterized protein with beta-barrel porin domain
MRATANLARLLAATAFCVVTATQANAADNGLESSDGTLVTNPDGSAIQGDLNGIYAFGDEFNLDNAGTIRGDGTTGGIDASNGGVVVTGGPADITNSGTISGARFGITTLPLDGEGLALFSTVDNSGTVIGDNDDGIRLQGGGTVTNSGYIAGRVTGGADGVSIFFFSDQDTTGLTSAGSVTNTVNGAIEGNRYGVIISGGGTVDNAGTVTGNVGGIVIQTQVNDHGRTGDVTNSGTVNGGVAFFSLDSSSLDNSGTISATAGHGVQDNNGSLAVTNEQGGSITGSASGIFSAGSSLSVDNAGTIRGDGTALTPRTGDGGIQITGGPATIVNSGTISGAGFGITTGNYSEPVTNMAIGRAIGSTVSNSGSIIGDSNDGIRLIGGGTVTNSGYIAGRVGAGADGISMFAFEDQDTSSQTGIGTVNNLAGGTIEGARLGVILSGGGTVNNAGTINGGASGAILIQTKAGEAGRVGTVNNSGTVNGTIGFNDLASASLTNSGAISTSTGAAIIGQPTSLTIDNAAAGTITGASSGIFQSGAAMTLDNAGTIRGNGTSNTLRAADAGILITGGAADIVNTGTISGAGFGITTGTYSDPDTNAASSRAIGVTVDNSGTIIGDSNDGIRLIGGGTVTNSGYIAGRVGAGADGVSMFSFEDQDMTGVTSIGTVNNLAGGIIEGARIGVILSNGGTINNAGTISGAGAIVIQGAPNTGKVGILNNSGTLNGAIGFHDLANVGVTNSGTINGTIDFDNSAAGSLTNSGAINGGTGTVVSMTTGNDNVTLHTGSSISGAVDGRTGSDVLTLLGTVNSATSAQTVGQFLGFETLFVLGGYWTIPGSDSFGSATITGSTLAVNGSLTASTFVGTGGVLAGTGTVTGNVTIGNGGVLNPGNGVGTLTISGNLQFASGSTFVVDTTAAGLSDLLSVTGGSISLSSGSTLEVLGGSGTYGPKTSYTIATAPAGINGKFGNVITDLAFLSPQVAIKNSSIVLTLTRNSRPIRGAAAADTLSTATAVSLLEESNPIYQAVLAQTLTGARQAFGALSGSAYSRLDAMMAGDFGRMELSLDGSTTAPALAWSGVNSLGAKGYQFDSRRARGGVSLLTVGGQYVTHFSEGGVNADLATRFVGTGLGFRSGGFDALAGMTAATHEVAVGRAVRFPGFSDGALSTYVARTYRFDAEGSYAVSRGRFAMAPCAGYSRIMLRTPAFTESGGVSALSFEAENRSVDQLRVGTRLRGEAPIGALTLAPHVDASLQRAFGDVRDSRGARFITGNQGFDSIGAGFNSRSLDVDAGLDVLAGPVTIAGRYRAQLGDVWRDRSATLSASLHF